MTMCCCVAWTTGVHNRRSHIGLLLRDLQCGEATVSIDTVPPHHSELDAALPSTVMGISEPFLFGCCASKSLKLKTRLEDIKTVLPEIHMLSNNLPDIIPTCSPKIRGSTWMLGASTAKKATRKCPPNRLNERRCPASGVQP